MVRQVSVSLDSDADTALTRVCARTRFSEDDVINRAVAYYDIYEGQMRAGNKLMVLCPDGTMAEVAAAL